MHKLPNEDDEEKKTHQLLPWDKLKPAIDGHPAWSNLKLQFPTGHVSKRLRDEHVCNRIYYIYTIYILFNYTFIYLFVYLFIFKLNILISGHHIA